MEHVRLQRALADWGQAKNLRTFAGVMREMLLGQVLLEASDSTGPMGEPGSTLAIAHRTDGQRKDAAVGVHE